MNDQAKAWVEKRRALLAKTTRGEWHVLRMEGAGIVAGPLRVNTRGEASGHTKHVVGEMDDMDVSRAEARRNAKLIVAAVNEQEAVIRLVEAVGRLRRVIPMEQPDEWDEMQAALAAVVGAKDGEPATPSPAPVCATCNDTHKMTVHLPSGDTREAMCTRCPRPCETCRGRIAGGGGLPYCAVTPCACDCHARELAAAKEPT